VARPAISAAIRTARPRCPVLGVGAFVTPTTAVRLANKPGIPRPTRPEVAHGTFRRAEMVTDRVRKLLLAAAWSAALAIVVLTAVPPDFRPTTDAPHDVEHAAAFLILGLLFGVAYVGRERTLIVGLVVFCAMIEILQLYVPGRHARWIDFSVDAVAAVIGVFAGAFGNRALRKRGP
jgi:VanZ family protein